MGTWMPCGKRQSRWLVLSAVLIAACPKPAATPDSGPADSGDDAGVDSGVVNLDGGSISESQFEADLVAALCSVSSRCALTNFWDQDACQAAQQLAAGGFNGPGTIAALIDGGAVVYDPASAENCLSEISLLDCTRANTPVGELPGCAATLQGSTGDSLRCVADVQCIPGDFCFLSDVFDGGFCGGFCGARLTRCTTNADCQKTELCDQSNVCVPFTPGNLGGPCGPQDTCGPGLGCFPNPTPGGPNVCEPPASESDGGITPCTVNHLCPTSPGAQPQTCVVGTCETANPPTAAGLPCNLFPYSNCAVGLACVPNDSMTANLCVVSPEVDGGTCQHIFDCGGIYSSTYCSESSHRCVPRPTAPNPCWSPAVDGGTDGGSPVALCDVTTSYCSTNVSPPTCVAYLASQSTCMTDVQCGPPWAGAKCLPAPLPDGGLGDAGSIDGNSWCVVPPAASCGE